MALTRTKRYIAAAFTLLLVSLSVFVSRAEVLPEPQTRASASFPHDKPKHRSLECSRCHAISPAQIDVREMPGHRSCIECHNFALEAFTKGNQFCGICHNGRATSKAQPALFRFPKESGASDFGENFSHPSHLKPFIAPASRAEQTPRCIDCHKLNQAGSATEMSIRTGHAACFECHGSNPIKPPSMFQCAQCHQVGGVHAPHLYNVVREFKHADHDYDIRPRKKADLRVPRAPDFLCAECHSSVAGAAKLNDIKLPAEQNCAVCHNGRIGLPDPLARNIIEILNRR